MPLIQPPIMKLLTSKEELKIMMKQPRYVSRLEKIAFPVVMALIVNIFLPPVAPLITMLMLGNLLRECLVVTKLAETASNTLLNMVTLVLTVAIGSTISFPADVSIRLSVRQGLLPCRLLPAFPIWWDSRKAGVYFFSCMPWVRIWQACLVRRFLAVLCWLCFPEEIFAQIKWFSLRVAVCPPSFL